MGATADELLAMLTFVRVVDGRSFTAAAAALGVAKSVVSARVAALESELKVRLLHRTTRKLSLTPDGLALYQRCAPVVAAADAASLAVAGTGDTPRGVLRVNAPVAFAEEYLAAPVAGYLARYPHVRIELAVNDRLVDLVDERVDVAVRVTSRLGGGTGVVARKLAVDRTVLVASPGYLARRGTPQTAEDVLAHDCLAYALLKISDEWRFRVPTPGGRGESTYGVPIEPRFTAASGALLRRAALADMGLAVLPSFMVAADVAAGRLRPVVEAFVGTPLGVHAIYPRARPVPAKTRTFVDALVVHFRTARW
jgi:DNA-binding transcriptional LysR family regulator